ncbi:hypothetical protein D4Q85_01105, partial [bacterium]
TLTNWLRLGREYNAAPPEERRERHANLGLFAADMDRAAGQVEATLYARVMKGAEKDGRLAFDVIRWNADKRYRTAKVELAEAQATVETKRAEGSLIDHHDVTSGGKPLKSMTHAELLEEREALLARVKGSASR